MEGNLNLGDRRMGVDVSSGSRKVISSSLLSSGVWKVSGVSVASAKAGVVKDRVVGEVAGVEVS